MNREDAISLVKNCEKQLSESFDIIDDIALYNTQKVLNAFRSANVNLTNMACSSGYGYEDIGKPKLCTLYKEIFGAEDAIVCPQIT